MPVDPEPPELPVHTTPSLGEAVLAGAVAAQAADTLHAGHGRPIHTHCENCGAPLQGAFCHQCGQHDIEFHRSFGHVFLEALENFLHFDAKFFRNIITLLFRPGQLSADFNAGKRASQMPPFRLYLFISVLFFLVASLGSDSPATEGEKANFHPRTAAENTAARAKLAAAFDQLAQESADPAFRARLQQAATQLRDPKVPAISLTGEQLRGVPKALAKQVRKQAAAENALNLDGMPDLKELAAEIREGNAKSGPKRTAGQRELGERLQRALEHQHEVQEAFVHALPKMLLACLPFFALITRVLFRGTGYVYLQHLVVALHYHTFVYLWWVVSRGWVKAVYLGSPGLAAFLEFGVWTWILLYPLLMLRRLFGQSWTRTFIKTGLLACAYATTLFCGFVATAAIVFMLV